MSPLPGLLTAILAQLLHAALLLAVLPVLSAGMGWLQARLRGRHGPSLLAPWREIRRLARQQPVLAEHHSPVFQHAPLVRFAALLTAALLVPSFALGMIAAPAADLLAIAGLLALARGAEILAALDAGTGQAGHAGAQTMAHAALSESALLLLIFALASLTGTTNLDQAVALLRETAPAAWPVLAIVGVALIGLVLADNGRHPFAAPDAWRLEYSGRDLALIEAGTALRLLTWGNLLAAITAPFGFAAAAAPLDWPVGLAAWCGKLLVLTLALVLFEAGRAHLQPSREAEFLGTVLGLGLLALVMLFAMAGGA